MDWYSFATEGCLLFSYGLAISDNERIGGEGVAVEIDESKFAKRK